MEREIASLIETCKLNAVDPHAYLGDVLTRLINRHAAKQGLSRCRSLTGAAL